MIYIQKHDYFKWTEPSLLPFLKGKYQITEYDYLNDNVLNTYFAKWNYAEVQS
jgi:hypothetical protein